MYVISPLSEMDFYLGHIMLLPPSMARVCPVMKEAPGLARKATVSATWKTKVVVLMTSTLVLRVSKVQTSCTVPGRPMAWVVLLCSRNLLKYNLSKSSKK